MPDPSLHSLGKVLYTPVGVRALPLVLVIQNIIPVFSDASPRVFVPRLCCLSARSCYRVGLMSPLGCFIPPLAEPLKVCRLWWLGQTSMFLLDRMSY